MGVVKERIRYAGMGRETAWGAGAATLAYMRVKKWKSPSGRSIPGSENYVQQDVMDRPSVFREPGEVEFTLDAYPATGVWPTDACEAPTDMVPVPGLLSCCLSAITAAVGYGVLTTGSSPTALILVGGSLGGTPTAEGFKVGDPIFVRAAGSDSVLGFNRIKSINDGTYTITLASPLPSAPLTGAIVMGSYYNYLHTAYAPGSFELTEEGDGAFNRQQNLGCMLSSLSLTAPFRGLPEFVVKFKSAKPIPPALAESGGNPGVEAWAWGNASQVIDGGLYLWDGSTNHKIQGGVEIDFGLNLVENPGINGVDPNGVDSYTLESRKIVVKVQPNWVSNALFALGDSETSSLVLTGWFGKGARSQGFQIPVACITKFPERVSRDGVVDLSMEFSCLANDGDGTGTAGTGKNAPFVYAQLAPEAA